MFDPYTEVKYQSTESTDGQLFVNFGWCKANVASDWQFKSGLKNTVVEIWIFLTQFASEFQALAFVNLSVVWEQKTKQRNQIFPCQQKTEPEYLLFLVLAWTYLTVVNS